MAFSSLRSLFSTIRSFYTLPVPVPAPVVRAAFSCNNNDNFASMSKKNILNFDREEDMAVSLAKYTADLSFKFSQERGSFSLLLSGGSLVNSLRKLLEPPYIDSVEWSRWRVFWVDERIVPKDHDECNYKLAYDCFLSRVPILPGNVYAINEALSAEGAADDYETCLRHLVKCGVIDISAATGFPKFDLMLVGIDSNGHIASEFTEQPLLQEDNGKWVTFTKESPKTPVDTITLTFPVINSSAYKAMIMTSDDKAGSLLTSVKNSQESAVKIPIQWASPQGELTWFLNRGCT